MKLLPENNLSQLVDGIATSSAVKNLSYKGKQDSQKKKKSIHIKLLCCSLILSYNKIRSLMEFQPIMSQVMPSHSNLQWLDLSHNYLQQVDYNFSHYPLLKTVYLHCNYIYDFNGLSKLQILENLKTFTIYGNPLAQVANFRNYVICILPQLRKLDSVLISSKERNNSLFLRAQVRRLPKPKKIAQPPQEINEDQEQEEEKIN